MINNNWQDYITQNSGPVRLINLDGKVRWRGYGPYSSADINNITKRYRGVLILEIAGRAWKTVVVNK